MRPKLAEQPEGGFSPKLKIAAIRPKHTEGKNAEGIAHPGGACCAALEAVIDSELYSSYKCRFYVSG